MLLFAFIGIVRAQNIVKSLERYVPGQGKVTIHQDPRIEALLGTEYVATGEQTILKSPGYRVQVYAGNNSRTGFKSERIFSGFENICLFYFSPLALSCGRFP